MELRFIGADHEVTGSCHCLQVAGKTILVDYGMEQGRDRYENAGLPVKASQIDAVFVTHAHIDHSGMIPKLIHDGFTGEIHATGATMALCDLMLRDSAHIQSMEAEWKNKKADRQGEEEVEPLYTLEDAIAAMRFFIPHDYGKIYELCEGIKYRFTDVGHLLGSSSIEFWLTENGVEKKIVFSGDIGNKEQPILKDPTYTTEADYVVTESTYGNRLHEKENTDYVADLVEILRDTFRRGGNVVIPAFAVGRTQVMLYYLRQIKQEGLLPEYPDFQVFVDSPMAVSATEIFSETTYEYFDEETQEVLRKGINPITFKGLELTISTEESKMINENTSPKVILSASGMCDAGRIKHHLKYNVWRKDSTIVFVGYQTEGTLGRKLIEGEPTVKIFGEEINVAAKVVMLQGMSGHADKDGLLAWVKAFSPKPQHVFVVHGDDEVAEGYAEELRTEHGLTATAPYSGCVFDLITGEYSEWKEGVPVVKQTSYTKVSDSYTHLKIAEKRLEQIISESTGLTNKELDAFARDLQELCRKYKLPEEPPEEGGEEEKSKKKGRKK